ncbi:hypothetical protein LAZ67_9002589 [Cordylochernes scorpioides]|uniref:Reverse transcriptase domain-containing protein n=1 Tax=Cordylochernes scorpioides TaxID=51811 RepID=A0ABY6KXA2_9ARAC|nr:hypothetical protein LAZ67_9002589 [Cordylochernes scorpioides]
MHNSLYVTIERRHVASGVIGIEQKDEACWMSPQRWREKTWLDRNIQVDIHEFTIYESLATRCCKTGRPSGGILIDGRSKWQFYLHLRPWLFGLGLLCGDPLLLDLIENFQVECSPYSDHLPITLSALTVPGSDRRITSLQSMTLNEIHLNWNHSIDSIMRLLTDKIIDTMGKAGMQRRSKTSNPNSKPWFDRECYLTKNNTKSHLKIYMKSKKETDSVNYISKKKFYAALIRDKKKKNTTNHCIFIQGNISLQEWHQFYGELLSSETSTEYILPILNTLSNYKAAGIDEVPNEAIKLFPHSYLLLLKDLYNRIVRSAVFPLSFSKSIIHPIFKNGDSDNPSNYRGFSLLSNFAKLFIAILRSRLVKWIETNDIIPENQAGFRSAHSCQDHIFILTSVIQLALRKKRGKCYSFFVDLKKAFDTVSHALLWTKLVKIGLNHRFVNLIKCYYEDMTAAVRWNNSITEFIEIRSGVLQGDPLSPCLFLLFINDLIKIFDDSGLSGRYLPNFGNIHLLLYADDIVLIGDSKINLQLKINIL